MMELLSLYRWTLPAGAVFAGALALLGCHLAARDRAMQTVCVSQGAMLGVLLALGGMQSLTHADPDSHFGPFLSSIGISALTFMVTNALAKRRSMSKNTLFAAIFSILLASGYFVSALFPALESHMAQIYFGDLATLTEYDAKVTLLLGIVCLGGLIAFWKPLSNQSFETAVFGEYASSFSRRAGRRWTVLFNLLALAMLCFSVQFLGFLFTIATLFLPTTILTYLSLPGLRKHLALAVLTASTGATAGFLMSLRFTRFPTVPSIVLSIWIISFVLVGIIYGLRLKKGFSTAPDPKALG